MTIFTTAAVLAMITGPTCGNVPADSDLVPFSGVAYCITNSLTGERYIGITENPVRRWAAHKRSSRRPNPRTKISRAIAKYGDENFSFEIVASACSWSDLCALERILIEQAGTYWELGDGYNLTLGGDGVKGLQHSSKTRLQMSEKRKGKPHSRLHTAAIARALTGKKLSLEHRAKISLNQIGRPMGEALKAKLRKANTGRKRTPEVNLRILISRGAIWPEDKVNRFATLWNSGVITAVIAQEFGIDRSHVSHKAKSLGLIMRIPQRKKVGSA